MRTKMTNGSPPPSPSPDQPVAGKTAAEQLDDEIKNRPKTPSNGPGKSNGSTKRATVPHDVVNEQVLLVAALDTATRASIIDLPSDHFYGQGHPVIWRGLQVLHAQGLPYSPPALHVATGGKADVEYLLKLVAVHIKVPDAATLRYHVEQLKWDKQRQELARGPAQKFLKQLSEIITTPEELRATIDEMRGVVGPASADGAMGMGQIFEPLGPINWLVHGLELCPGAPSMIGGYGFSGKTVASQALIMSLVSGAEVWAKFPGRHARALHLDYEQGSRLTRERYQRIARYLGVDPSSLRAWEWASRSSGRRLGIDRIQST